MTTTSYTTRQAESLYLTKKYAHALLVLQDAIQTAVQDMQELFSGDIPAQSNPAQQQNKESGSDPSFLSTEAKKYGYQLAADRIISVLLSLQDKEMWSVISKDSPNALLYVAVSKDRKYSLRTPAAKHARLFAQYGETYFQCGRTISPTLDDGLVPIEKFNEYAKIALNNLELATKLNPNYAWAYAKMGEIYRVKANRYGNSDARQLDYKNALDNFTQATNHDPNYAWAWAHLGATICNNPDSTKAEYEAAQGHLTKAITLMNGEYPWATAYQGAVYFRQAVAWPDSEELVDWLEQAQMYLLDAMMTDKRVLDEPVQPGLRHTNIYLAFTYLLLKQGEAGQQDQLRRAFHYCYQALQKAKPGEMNYARALYYMAVYLYKNSRNLPSNMGTIQPVVHRTTVSLDYVHQELVGVASGLLGHVVSIESPVPLSTDEKQKLQNFLKDENKKTAIEEVCTMLLVTDVMINHETNVGHLPRILEILTLLQSQDTSDKVKLSPSQDTPGYEQIFARLQHAYEDGSIVRLLDDIIWKEKHALEAIKNLMEKSAQRKARAYV